MEYSSFLCKSLSKELKKDYSDEFPSPYGVSFILIGNVESAKAYEDKLKFPSPCGALFILMGYGPKTKCKIKLFKVSVSLRSIIHSYKKY